MNTLISLNIKFNDDCVTVSETLNLYSRLYSECQFLRNVTVKGPADKESEIADFKEKITKKYRGKLSFRLLPPRTLIPLNILPEMRDLIR
jgi:hypothetical protein